MSAGVGGGGEVDSRGASPAGSYDYGYRPGMISFSISICILISSIHNMSSIGCCDPTPLVERVLSAES